MCGHSTSSYGFRPGRSCHDAIEAIFCLSRPRSRRRWVIGADIKGAFDHIDQTFLLKTIGDFPARELIRQWLKAGYMENGVVHDTLSGTPQGGVISPLLANIALHGMEETLGVVRNKIGDNIGSRAVARYADDFVVYCTTQEEAEAGIELLKTWVGNRGLELSEEKTRIVHLTEGFDFLGFQIRLYEVGNTKSGTKVLIKPSDKAVKKLRRRLRAEWRSCVGLNVAATIARIRPIIIGWANYYRSGVSSKTFQHLDNWMWTRITRWMKRAHPHKSWGWLCRRYLGQFHPGRKDRWVFGDKQTGHYLPKFAWTRIERHVKVKGTSSPDDARLKRYWWKRGINTLDLSPTRQKLAKAQGYRCPVCGGSLANGEEIHHHHILPQSKGGTDESRNIRLVHLYCHQQAHSPKGASAPKAAKRLLRDA